MKYKAYNIHNFKEIPQLNYLNRNQIEAIEIVSKVLPFRTNNYVINELINWNNLSDDPIFVLNFPQKEMLSEENYNKVEEGLKYYDKKQFNELIENIRYELNPHPAGQMEYNTPYLKGKKIIGLQHKYKETVLFFPSQGQSCHAYCTFCFRWPQFVGMNDIKFALKESEVLIEYLRENPQVTDILITGGDPMVMSARNLSIYINAILEAKLNHIKTIRIGTKSLSFWPYRYTTDKDAGEILDLFKKVNDSGLNLAFMTHFSHPRELSTDAVQGAIYKIRETGTQIRSQSPILRHINDNSEVWKNMWRKQVDLGIIPYYMFIARETGAQKYFAVSLEDAYMIYREAYSEVSGICRTVRGPSMSANPGKVCIHGISTINNQKYFVLSFIQARNSNWVGTPFLAKYNKNAQWLSDLEPAFNENQFFYEAEFENIMTEKKSIYSNKCFHELYN